MKRTEETWQIANTALHLPVSLEGDAMNDSHYFAFVF